MEASVQFPMYESYKDSGVEWLGVIPEHWATLRAKRVFRDVSIKGNPEAELLSVTQDQGVVPRSYLEQRVVMPSGALESFKLVEKNNFVISLRSFQGGIEHSEHEGIVSPAYTVLKNIKGIPAGYLKYLLKSQGFISELNTTVTGIRQGKNIDFKDFSMSFLPIPLDAEAERIAEFLDHKTAEIDTAIAKKQELIQLLNEQKAILINRAVTKGLNPDVKMKDSGVAWIGEIPEHWNFSRVGFLAEVGNGSTPNRSNLRYWNQGSVGWLNSSKVNDGIIHEAEQFVTPMAVKECHLPIVKENSIVIAITGEGKTRGMSALLKISATINQHLAYIRLKKNDITPEYLHLYLQAIYDFIRIESSGTGSTKGAITCGQIRKFPIPIPPRSEQEYILNLIGDSVASNTKAIKSIQREIQFLTELKQTLITHTTTGKIKV